MTNPTRHVLRADPNVTPLIDVLLVLLVIFMVVTPTKSRGIHAALPQNAPSGERPTADDNIVLTVLRNGTVQLNRQVVALADLDTRLKELFAAAPNHVLFVRGDRDLDFQQVAQVIDIAKGAGLHRIGLVTR